MRIVPARNQYFAYRVLLGPVELVDSSALSMFGIVHTPQPGTVPAATLKAWSSFLHDTFTGEAYNAPEAKRLSQSWCFDKAKILDQPVYYFGFTTMEDASLFVLKFKKRRK